MYCHGRIKTDDRLFICPHINWCSRYSRKKDLKYFSVLPVTEAGECHEFKKKPNLIKQSVNKDVVVSVQRRKVNRPSKTYKQGDLFA
jgi:hypothetical protein